MYKSKLEWKLYKKFIKKEDEEREKEEQKKKVFWWRGNSHVSGRPKSCWDFWQSPGWKVSRRDFFSLFGLEEEQKKSEREREMSKSTGKLT